MRKGARHKTVRRIAIILAAVVFVLASGALIVNAATSSSTSPHRERSPRLPFTVKARFAQTLSPGLTTQVWLRFGNRTRNVIWITSLSFKLQVDRAHRLRGCSATRDYRTFQLTRKAFPIKVTQRRRYRSRAKRRKARWLTPRMLRVNGRPAVTMVDLQHVNQDACKGAVLKMTFRGRATNRKPRKRPRSTVRTAQSTSGAKDSA